MDTKLTCLICHVTNSCNLRCKHCWVDGGIDVEPVALTTEKWLSAIDESIPLGSKSVKFTGGEPFLRDDLLTMMEHCRKQDLGVSIETNGTFITDEKAAKMKSLGVSVVAISLDSATPEFHDWFRGQKGAHEKAIKGIKNCVNNKLSTHGIFSVCRENLEHMQATIELCTELGLTSLKINPVSPSGRAVNESEITRFDIKEMLELYEKVLEANRAKKWLTLVMPIPPAFQSLTSLTAGPSFECDICNRMAVLPDGSVSLCGIGQTLREMVMGNVNHESLETIWENSLKVKEMRENIPSKLEGICGNCMHSKRCKGYCRSTAITLTGNLYAPNPICQEAYANNLFPVSRMSRIS